MDAASKRGRARATSAAPVPVRRSARLAAKASAGPTSSNSPAAALPVTLPRAIRPRASTPRRQSARRAAPNRRAKSARTQREPMIHILPDEILWIILGDMLEAPWHSAAAQVSHRWRDVVVAWAARMPRGSLCCPRTFRLSTMRDAISSDAKSVAIWLRDRCDCPMGPWAFNAARYLYDYRWWVVWLRAATPPCPWHPEAAAYAINGSEDMRLVAWMRAQDDPCPWHPRVSERAATYDCSFLAATTPPPEHCATGAYVSRVPPRMAWLRAQNPPCPWDTGTCSAVGWYTTPGCIDGALAVLRWLRAQEPPCPWNSGVLVGFAAKASVEVFGQIQDMGAPCGSFVASTAARYGRLDILALILERHGSAAVTTSNPIWTENVVSSAASAPEPRPLIEWLLDVALCPVDFMTCDRLAHRGDIETLEWARKRGIGFDPCSICCQAAVGSSESVLAWLRDIQAIDHTTAHRVAGRCAKGRFVEAVRLVSAYWPYIDAEAVLADIGA